MSFEPFDSCGNLFEENIKRRRPDRILGFQETRSFSRRLREHNLIASRSQDEAGLETLWETVDSTV
jgi:hypothetical protein